MPVSRDATGAATFVSDRPKEFHKSNERTCTENLTSAQLSTKIVSVGYVVEVGEPSLPSPLL